MYNSSGIVLAEKPSFGVEPTRLYDASRFRNHGTLLGAGEPNAVQLPSGLWVWEFDGSNDYISIPHNDVLNFTTAFSFITWIKPQEVAPVNGGYVFSKGYFSGVGDNGEYMLFLNPSSLVPVFVCRGDSLDDMNGNVLTQDAWTQVIGTFEGGVARRLYKQGELDVEDLTQIATLKNTTNALNIGRLQRTPTSTHQKMQLRPPIFLNYALTAGQSRNIFEAQRHWYPGA